jgi:hypothetical protein
MQKLTVIKGFFLIPFLDFINAGDGYRDIFSLKYNDNQYQNA